jgi:hypothetical protein
MVFRTCLMAWLTLGVSGSWLWRTVSCPKPAALPLVRILGWRCYTSPCLRYVFSSFIWKLWIIPKTLSAGFHRNRIPGLQYNTATSRGENAAPRFVFQYRYYNCNLPLLIKPNSSIRAFFQLCRLQNVPSCFFAFQYQYPMQT